MTLEQEDRVLAILRTIQADVAGIRSEIARQSDRLRRLDDMFASFRTDYQNAQA